MSHFLKEVDGDLVLNVLGYCVTVLVLLILLGAGTWFAWKLCGKKRGSLAFRQLAFCAMAIALATVTSNIKVYSFPFGGSITLCSMLFICLIGYFYGPECGFLTGAAHGVLQFLLGAYILTPIQVLIDYPLAFAALGLSGFFWKSKHGLIKGYLAGVCGRYFFAVLSGWIFFGEYAWDGWGALPYSLVYNAIYIFAEAAITVIILMIPAVSKAIAHVKEMARV